MNSQASQEPSGAIAHDVRLSSAEAGGRIRTARSDREAQEAEFCMGGLFLDTSFGHAKEVSPSGSVKLEVMQKE